MRNRLQPHREDPYQVPCWKVFEPDSSSGCRIVSLGFSVRAEIAHRNQCWLPWYKVLGQIPLPITSTVGALRSNFRVDHVWHTSNLWADATGTHGANDTAPPGPILVGLHA